MRLSREYLALQPARKRGVVAKPVCHDGQELRAALEVKADCVRGGCHFFTSKKWQ
jgi:hypothetical protein